ncbi:unnamed protein product [Phaeothamnion confervicola]
MPASCGECANSTLEVPYSTITLPNTPVAGDVSVVSPVSPIVSTITHYNQTCSSQLWYADADGQCKSCTELGINCHYFFANAHQGVFVSTYNQPDLCRFYSAVCGKSVSIPVLCADQYNSGNVDGTVCFDVTCPPELTKKCEKVPQHLTDCFNCSIHNGGDQPVKLPKRSVQNVATNLNVSCNSQRWFADMGNQCKSCEDLGINCRYLYANDHSGIYAATYQTQNKCKFYEAVCGNTVYLDAVCKDDFNGPITFGTPCFSVYCKEELVAGCDNVICVGGRCSVPSQDSEMSVINGLVTIAGNVDPDDVCTSIGDVTGQMGTCSPAGRRRVLTDGGSSGNEETATQLTIYTTQTAQDTGMITQYDSVSALAKKLGVSVANITLSALSFSQTVGSPIVNNDPSSAAVDDTTTDSDSEPAINTSAAKKWNMLWLLLLLLLLVWWVFLLIMWYRCRPAKETAAAREKQSRPAAEVAANMEAVSPKQAAAAAANAGRAEQNGVTTVNPLFQQVAGGGAKGAGRAISPRRINLDAMDFGTTGDDHDDDAFSYVHPGRA